MLFTALRTIARELKLGNSVSLMSCNGQYSVEYASNATNVAAQGLGFEIVKTYTSLTTNELMQCLSNATLTAMICTGHTKTVMNEMKAKEYKRALKRRKVAIPADKELAAAGIFNGGGAW